jgi:hypothetical protein
MNDVTQRPDGLNDLDVLLVLYPGEDDSPMVNATLLVCDNGAGLVMGLPADDDDADPESPLPTAEVYCVTSQSFFDVIRCGDDLMAFPTSPALRDADDSPPASPIGVVTAAVNRKLHADHAEGLRS